MAAYRVVEEYSVVALFGKRVIDENVVIGRDEDRIHEFVFHLQSFHQFTMKSGAVTEFGVLFLPLPTVSDSE